MKLRFIATMKGASPKAASFYRSTIHCAADGTWKEDFTRHDHSSDTPAEALAKALSYWQGICGQFNATAEPSRQRACVSVEIAPRQPCQDCPDDPEECCEACGDSGFVDAPDSLRRLKISVTACQRCTRLCRTGTPDPKARAIVHGQQGLCPDCMLQRMLRSIEPLAPIYDHLPEYLQNVEWRERTLRPLLASVLGHTQMQEREIHYDRVVRNWHLPWPVNRHGTQLELL